METPTALLSSYDYLLSGAIMRNYYTIHNLQNNSIGFAETASSILTKSPVEPIAEVVEPPLLSKPQSGVIFMVLILVFCFVFMILVIVIVVGLGVSKYLSKKAKKEEGKAEFPEGSPELT
jgi:hypothetical protein